MSENQEFNKNMNIILQSMPCHSPITTLEALTALTFYTSIYNPPPESSFTYNDYTKFDAVIFTYFFVRIKIVAKLKDNFKKAAILDKFYTSLLLKTASNMFFITDEEIVEMFNNRVKLYDEFASKYDNYSELIIDKFIEALSYSQNNKYTPIDNSVLISDFFCMFQTKAEVLAYSSCIPQLFDKAVSNAIADYPFNPVNTSPANELNSNNASLPLRICNFFRANIKLFLVATIILAILVFITNITSENDTVKNTINETQLPKVTPPEHNDVLQFTDYTPNFEIKSSYDDNIYYYMKVVDAETDETIQTIFIHSGQTASMYVPNGTYKIRWTSGKTWYGYDHLFNNRYAQEADDLFTFSDTEGWEITLYPVTNGNLETSSIDIDTF